MQKIRVTVTKDGNFKEFESLLTITSEISKFKTTSASAEAGENVSNEIDIQACVPVTGKLKNLLEWFLPVN